MTPDEIRKQHLNINQRDVDVLACYLNNWMKSTGQVDKELVKVKEECKKDGCLPFEQANVILGSIVDWFSYGN